MKFRVTHFFLNKAKLITLPVNPHGKPIEKSIYYINLQLLKELMFKKMIYEAFAPGKSTKTLNSNYFFPPSFPP